MARKSARSPAQLPQSSDRWLLATVQLRVWVAPPGVAPSCPYLVFVLNGETGAMRASDITAAEPAAGDVRKTLLAAMQTPISGSGKPARPAGIIVTSEAIGKSIAEAFEAEPLGIEIYLSEMPDEVMQIVRELEENMRGRPELPGLLTGVGVTPDLLAGFYAAAAAFYRAAPWAYLANIHVLALRHPAERAFRYALVLGNGGMEYGLTVYQRWADVERIFAGDAPPFELLPAEGVHSVSFETIDKMPFDDLDALQQNHWEIAAADAYPVPVIIDNRGAVRRPTRADLAWYEAALRAIPLLLREHLRPNGRGDYQPLETTVSVSTHAGGVSMTAKYPAGPLRLSDQPAQRLDWSEEGAAGEALPVDFRAMEGTMFQLTHELGAPAGTGGRTLERAQQLMYRAWEERNPAKRIALAHDALAASPDCADAYVLLAEEEAPTVEKALEYYRAGVAAGERALGSDYFAENAGHFWGLLETRPYMRARLGLADTLWRLLRTDEAIAHYREMLRLNPGDNQGVRYLLLSLLMRLEGDADVGPLLAQYADDAMAVWLYSRALYEFRAAGASQRAGEALREALTENRHVPAYLLAEKRIPHALPQTIGFGNEDEAIHYAHEHLNTWRRSAGALDWLKSQIARKPAGTRKRIVLNSGRRH